MFVCWMMDENTHEEGNGYDCSHPPAGTPLRAMDERERWRRELGAARHEANKLREELMHRQEEAGRLQVRVRPTRPNQARADGRTAGRGGLLII